MQVSCHLHPPPPALETKCLRKRNFPASPSWSSRPTTGCGARLTSLWVHRNFFWQLSRDGNLHGSGMLHATTASPKPSFRAPWRVVDAMLGRGNAEWMTSKSGHSWPCQNRSQWPPAEKTGRGSLLNRSLCLSVNPIGQETELNLNNAMLQGYRT